MDRDSTIAQAVVDSSGISPVAAGVASKAADAAMDAGAVRLAAVSALHNNPNYLRAIASLAQTCPVWAVRTVVSEQQQVLLQERQMLGADFDAGWGDQRLTHALDEALAVSQSVDVATLLARVQQLQQTHPLVQAMTGAMGLQHSLLQQAVRQLVWPARAAFQLTVMRAHLPQLYEHSVLNMLVAVFLASQQGWNEAQCARVAAAALLHDVGMLYLPPAWKDAAYKLSMHERVQLSAHPVLGCAVIASMRAYPRSVEDAVLEHHERMDGGGYPRHLRGDAISPMGRMLLVAEVVSGLYEKSSDMPAQRLSLMLRMNAARYPQELVAPVLALLRQPGVVQQGAEQAQLTPPVDDPLHGQRLHQVLHQGRQLALVQQYWASCKKVLPAQWRGQRGAAAVEYIERCVQSLQQSLAASGADVRHQPDWAQLLQQDPRSVQELGLIVREALWQLERCAHTCAQRWPRLLLAPAARVVPAHPASLLGGEVPSATAAESAPGATLSVVERALGTWLHSARKLLDSAHADTLPAPAAAPLEAVGPSEPALTAEAITDTDTPARSAAQ